MRLEILVEEPSAERALSVLVARIIDRWHDFAIRSLRSKRELLATITGRLLGYSSWVRAADTKAVVLVDRDNDDCVLLKAVLEKAAADAGLPTLSTAQTVADVAVLNRIVIEEFEAWFFGVERNRAKSFQVFRDGLRRLVGEESNG